MDYDHADPSRAGHLYHVELYASGLDASVEFWGWLLGELGYEPKNDETAGARGSTGRRTSCSYGPTTPATPSIGAPPG